MKKLPKAAAALLMAAVMLLSACGPRGRSLNDTEKKDLSAQLTEYINRMDICGSVYAVYHGDVVLDIARGDYSGEGSDIVYAVASITKQFTATSIMQLYEQGKLDIDDKLGKYFPD